MSAFSLQPKGQSVFGHGVAMDYDLEIQLALGKEDKLLNYSTMISIRRKGDPETIANAQSVTLFQIFELSKYVEINEPDQFSVSQDLNLSMGKVAIGLTRGLLIAKFKESGFSNIILPLLPFEY